jgi:hypothetical protein
MDTQRARLVSTRLDERSPFALHVKHAASVPFEAAARCRAAGNRVGGG